MSNRTKYLITLIAIIFLITGTIGYAIYHKRLDNEKENDEKPNIDEIEIKNEFEEKVESINKKALLWLDTLNVDPIQLRDEMGIKGKKKFVELLDIYLYLYKHTTDAHRKKIYRDKGRALTKITRNPAYHNLADITDKQFHQDILFYLRAWYIMSEFGLNTTQYIQEIKEVLPRVYAHLPYRGITQKMSFVFYFERLGYPINYTIEKLFHRSVIRCQKSIDNLSKVEVYHITHEIFHLYDDDKMNILSQNDTKYLSKILPALVNKYIAENNVDILAELIVIMTHLKFTHFNEYDMAIEFLLNSQNENGSFGDYEGKREYYRNRGIDVDYLLYLHTAAVSLKALNTACIWLYPSRTICKEISTPNPQCRIDFSRCPVEVEIGREYEIIMCLENEGPPSSKEKGTFCGLHIEVENARAKNVLAYSALTGVKETKVRRQESIRWFEVTYDRLKEGAKGAVRFHIIPERLPVRIYYRSWIPVSVPKEEKRDAVIDLKKKFKAAGGWRHEGYIRRLPRNDDPSAPLCNVRVYAGHKEMQNYRCLVRAMKAIKKNEGKIDATIRELNQLGPEEKKFLLTMARQAIKVTAQGKKMTGPKDIPGRLADYSNTVYITLYKDGCLKGCRGSNRGNVVDAVIFAAVNIISDRRFDLPLGENLDWLEDIHISINIFAKKEEVKSRSLEKIKKELELGIHGVQIKRGKHQALFKDSVAITSRMNHKELLQSLCKKAKLDKDAWKEKATQIYKFRTLHFIEARNEQAYLDLMRAAPYIALKDVTRERCKQAIAAGGSWLIRNQRPDDGYRYLYYPGKDRYSKKDNIIRQAGCAYSLALVGRLTGNDIFGSSARKAINYILAKTKFVEGDENLPYVWGQRRGTLYGNALLLLAMVELEENEQYREMMKKLVNSILYMQNQNGSFKTLYEPVAEETGRQTVAPGEALLALARYYQRVNKDQRCLSAFSRAYPYYSRYWRMNKTAKFIPWQSQAWFEVYKITENKMYADFVFEMNNWMLDMEKKQFIPKNSLFPDYLGGFRQGKRPPGFGIAGYIEALTGAFQLANMLDDEDRVLKYRKALFLGVRFILNLEFTSQNMYYVRNKSRAEGGFRMSLTDNSLRCDVTQHCITALLKFLECFQDEDFDAFLRGK